MALREAAGYVPAPSMRVPHLPMTAERRQKFISYLEALGSYAEAAQRTDGINSAASYRRLAQTDSKFREQCEAATESFGSKILAVLRDEVIHGVKTPIVSNGEILAHVIKRDPRLVLAYARRVDPGFRDSKTVFNVDGTPAPDKEDVRIFLQPSDFWRLEAHDAQALHGLIQKIYQHRQEELAPLKNITPEIEGEIENAEFTEVEPMADDPWEGQPDLVPAVLVLKEQVVEDSNG